MHLNRFYNITQPQNFPKCYLEIGQRRGAIYEVSRGKRNMKNTYEGENHTVSKAQSFQNDNKKVLLLHRVSKQLIWFIKASQNSFV